MIKCIPQRVIRARYDLPWLDHSLRKKIWKKNKYHRLAKKAKPHKRDQLWWSCRKIQSDIKTEIHQAHDRYINSLFEDDSGKPSKKLWISIKAKKRDQVGVSPLKGRNGKLETTSKGKAQILNNQYSSVFIDDDHDIMPSMGASPYPPMAGIRVSVNGVKTLLQKLNARKAIGPDLLPMRLLKDFADEIAPILRVIFQQSLDTGKVPEVWKKANIATVFKKGERSIAANYRHVSIICVSCKVLEHIVFKSIMDHVDIHKILVHFQHGFRALHSCETQLLNTVEDLARCLNDRDQLDLLVLDFSKAFDTVAHQRLIGKLEYYGVRGSTLEWITQWLTKRVQRVVVDRESSEEAPVKSGVPQGTVLGPLMFILYINDISENTSSTVKLFADDCLIYRRIQCQQDATLLQGDLNQLCSWPRKWQMSFNPDKCSVLTITRKKHPVISTYRMLGTTLKHYHHHPYLGNLERPGLGGARQEHRDKGPSLLKPSPPESLWVLEWDEGESLYHSG